MRFDHSYAQLPAIFFAKAQPSAFVNPELFVCNNKLSETLGLSPSEVKSLTHQLSCDQLNGKAKGNETIALAYAGHQFGHFVPSLGDGRAILLGEIVSPKGARYDVHIKGAGTTPFSRGGDGRAALGPVIREYLVAEFMHHAGIPTTRGLAALTTGETIMRQTAKPGAALIRIGQSHIRVGTFEFFATRNDTASLKVLADYTIQRHYPACAKAEAPYLALLKAVIQKQADLMAAWQSVGFIHGVMNTDNMQIAGETLDYGPCAFMDHFDPKRVLSSIDHFGRYAYENQPLVAHWNLACLASAILPLLGDQATAIKQAESALEQFSTHFEKVYHQYMAAKLGLTCKQKGDKKLIESFLHLLHANKADFSLSFRELANCVESDAYTIPKSNEAQTWYAEWRDRLQIQNQSPDHIRAHLRRVNPLYIPRNHIIERVIKTAENDNDLTLFHQVLERLSSPFDEKENANELSIPPQEAEIVQHTFCGT